MKTGNYIELKVRKRFIVIFGILLVLLCSVGGYYVWCSYHPIISIGIGMGGRGDALKAQVPSVTIVNRHGIKMAASIELDVLNFWIQYDHMNEYIINNFKTSDIMLAIKVNDNQTVLKYTGTATTLEDEIIDFTRDIVCEFVLDATIEGVS